MAKSRTRKPKNPQERNEDGLPLRKDGTIDQRYANVGVVDEYGEPVGRLRGKQIPPRIDYNVNEPGISPQLQAMRYVCQHLLVGPNEDSLMAAARKLRSSNPQKFIDDWERLENDWKREKGELNPHSVAPTPLEIDRNSQKCLDAIEAFFARLIEEAKQKAKEVRWAVRGAELGTQS